MVQASTTNVDEIKRSLDNVDCSICGQEMELSAEGTQKSLPLFGTEIEYRQYRCEDCGQGIRFEREGSDSEWVQAAI